MRAHGCNIACWVLLGIMCSFQILNMNLSRDTLTSLSSGIDVEYFMASLPTSIFPTERDAGEPEVLSFSSVLEGETVHFEPGTIQASKAETYRHCHVSRDYGFNFQRSDNWEGVRMSAAFSDEHRLLYYWMPKCSSSTSRTLLKQHFNATDGPWPALPMDQYEKITFVRDPLSRFLSSFDESVRRRAPWLRDNKDRKQLFLFLYEGLTDIRDFKDGTCDEECFMKRFERFLTEHNPLRPFEPHLSLQMGLMQSWTKLTNGTKVGPLQYPIDAIYDVKNLDAEWKRIASSRNISLPGDKLKVIWSQRKLINRTAITKDSAERICRMTSLDYCCLNFRLPPECSDSGVSCVMKNIDGKVTIESANIPGIGGQYTSTEY